MESPLSLDGSQEVDKVLVCMTIDIGDGRQGYLEITAADDPAELARAFCEDHGLPLEKQAKLTGFIETYLAKASEPNTDRQVSSRNSKAPLRPANYGEALYSREMKHREEQQMEHLKLKKIEEQEQMQAMTFKPRINESSALISPRSLERTEDVLMRSVIIKRGRLEALAADVAFEKMNECTFSPKIDRVSARLANQKRPHGPLHEGLYREAQVRKERLETLSEQASLAEFSFKPNTSLSRRLHPLESKEAQLDRLYNSKKRFEAQMEEVRKYQENKETSLFVPSTGRAPTAPRNTDHKDIGEYLYELRDQKKTLTQAVWNEVEARRINQNSVRASQQSNRMYELFCLKHYERLFKLLDSDRDGLISADRISLGSIEDPVLVILQPIFEELQGTNEPMSFMDFVEKLHFIMSQLSLQDRSVILKRPKTYSTESEMKSNISKRTEELASHYRAVIPGELYERQMAAVQISESKLEHLKESLSQRELKECTFHPQTRYYPTRRERERFKLRTG